MNKLRATILKFRPLYIFVVHRKGVFNALFDHDAYGVCFFCCFYVCFFFFVCLLSFSFLFFFFQCAIIIWTFYYILFIVNLRLILIYELNQSFHIIISKNSCFIKSPVPFHRNLKHLVWLFPLLQARWWKMCPTSSQWMRWADEKKGKKNMH